jgi:hypothetical protein
MSLGDISFFNKVKDVTPARNITILQFLQDVKRGFYKSGVQKVRDIQINGKTSKEAQQKLKKLLPAVTVCGVFKKRN